MKKLFVLLAALILVAGVAFAQEGDSSTATQPAGGTETEPKKEREIELFNLEIYLGFPIHWTNGLHDDEFYRVINEKTGANMMEDKNVTANTSIGLGLTFNFTRRVGLTLDMDFFFGGKLGGFASPTSDYNSLTGANVFLGPVFYIFNNNMLRIPLSVGFHMYFFKDDLWVPEIYDNHDSGAWMNRKEYKFGPAISLGVQFHFSKTVYIFSQVGIAIDIIRLHSAKWFDGTDYNDDGPHVDIPVINWSVKPSLGLGIKFK